jgi:hypothetical protein
LKDKTVRHHQARSERKDGCAGYQPDELMKRRFFNSTGSSNDESNANLKLAREMLKTTA